jgi:hypothetical protein
MPIMKSTAGQVVNPNERSFAERMRAGRVVPVVSDEAVVDLVLGGWQELVQGYAGYVEYPFPDRFNLVKVAKYNQLFAFPDRTNLVKVAKYHQLFANDTPDHHGMNDQTLKSDYLNWVKNHIYFTAQAQGADGDLLAEAEAQVDDKTASEFAHLLGLPTFDREPSATLLAWADLPVRIVLTTSPYTFIEDALRRAGKHPCTELCRWCNELDTIEPAIDGTYRPSVQEPLVYHLHGLDAYPDSLVLTEDDHLEFLVNICQGQDNNSADRVHALVRQAIFNDLILFGYHLDTWSFRGLYAGLIKPNGKKEDRGVVALQVECNDTERRYLEDYGRREARFDVAWGNLQEYTQSLRQRVKGC